MEQHHPNGQDLPPLDPVYNLSTQDDDKDPRTARVPTAASLTPSAYSSSKVQFVRTEAEADRHPQTRALGPVPPGTRKVAMGVLPAPVLTSESIFPFRTHTVAWTPLLHLFFETISGIHRLSTHLPN